MNTRLAQWNLNVERHEQAHAFTDVCTFLLRSGGRTSDAIAHAKTAHAGDRVIKAIEGTIGGASGGWGSETAAFSVSYLQALAQFGGIFDFSLPNMQPAALHSRLVVISAFATGGEHSESALKIADELQAANGNTLDQRVAYAHILLSAELARLAGPLGRTIIDRAIRISTIAATDQIYLDALIAAAPAPTASSGDFLVDVQQLISLLDLRAGSRVVLVASATLVSRIATRSTAGGTRAFPNVGIAGGEIAPGLMLLPSDRIAQDLVLAADISQIAGAGGILVPSSANAAAVALNVGSPNTLTDTWSRNLLSLKIERKFGFELVNSAAVAVIDSAQYSQSAS